MKRTRLSNWLAACGCVGLVWPSSGVAADPQPNRSIARATVDANHASGPRASAGDASATADVTAPKAISDVALADDGGLVGTVVTSAGVPAVGKGVVLLKDGRPLATTTTDKSGQFRVAGLRGGVYQIQSGSGTVSCRLWAADTAPPAAEPAALVVADAGAVRGQRPLWDLANDPLIIGAIVVAAIAIPVAIHNARNNNGSSS